MVDQDDGRGLALGDLHGQPSRELAPNLGAPDPRMLLEAALERGRLECPDARARGDADPLEQRALTDLPRRRDDDLADGEIRMMERPRRDRVAVEAPRGRDGSQRA